MQRFVTIGPTEFRIDDSGGPGPALVCLHAGVCDRRMWAPQVAAFSPTHRVIAYDRRGFGQTRYVPERFSHVDDLIALLDALRIGSAVLMGCSQGGRFAIDAALAHPARVRALVLVASAVTGAPDDGVAEPAHVRAVIDDYERLEAGCDAAALNAFEARAWLDGPEAPEGRVPGPLRELFLDMNGLALAAPPVGEAVASPSAWERLEQIAVPTFVVWGTLDFPHIRRRMAQLVARVRGARSLVIDGVAHLPNLEAPGAFDEAVGAFLASSGVGHGSG